MAVIYCQIYMQLLITLEKILILSNVITYTGNESAILNLVSVFWIKQSRGYQLTMNFPKSKWHLKSLRKIIVGPLKSSSAHFF